MPVTAGPMTIEPTPLSTWLGEDVNVYAPVGFEKARVCTCTLAKMLGVVDPEPVNRADALAEFGTEFVDQLAAVFQLVVVPTQVWPGAGGTNMASVKQLAEISVDARMT